MKTVFTTLLLILQMQVFAQTLQTVYYNNKGKITTDPSKAYEIATSTLNDKGDLIAYERKSTDNRIITAYQCEDYIPVGPWIMDGKKVKVPINLANPYVDCMVNNEEIMSSLLPRKELLKFLMHTIHYPEYAIVADIQGTVVLVIDFDKNGAVENVSVKKSPNPILTLEAIRVIGQLKLDTSTLTDFEGIKCHSLPVSFKLN